MCIILERGRGSGELGRHEPGSPQWVSSEGGNREKPKYRKVHFNIRKKLL